MDLREAICEVFSVRGSRHPLEARCPGLLLEGAGDLPVGDSWAGGPQGGARSRRAEGPWPLPSPLWPPGHCRTVPLPSAPCLGHLAPTHTHTRRPGSGLPSLGLAPPKLQAGVNFLSSQWQVPRMLPFPLLWAQDTSSGAGPLRKAGDPQGVLDTRKFSCMGQRTRRGTLPWRQQ